MASSDPPPAKPVEVEPQGSDLDDELRPAEEAGKAGPLDDSTTAGWGEDEPVASILDDDPAPVAPVSPGPDLLDEADLHEPEPAWEDAPLSTPLDLDPGGWNNEGDGDGDGWDELPADVQPPPEAGPLWSDLEDETRLLPPGLERLGRVETVRLVGQDLPPLLARMDTGSAGSRLHATVVQQAGASVTVEVAGHRLELPRADDGPQDPERLWLRVKLRLGGRDLDATLSVQAPTDGEPVVLGCDVLAGRYVVDPAAQLLGRDRP